jgi:DNA-directed RNA polymerase specialized sigma24 family protein
MSGDSVPFALPLSHLATGACEATALYGELRKPLLRYLVCLGLSMDDAQDVMQEAFLSLHRHLTAGGSKENIRSWPFRVAHNRARNQQSSYGRRFGLAAQTREEAITVLRDWEQSIDDAWFSDPELVLDATIH